MHEFMLNYLKELHPDASDASLNVQAEAMVLETLPFIPISSFFWGVWGLLQVEVSPVGFGFAVCAFKDLTYKFNILRTMVETA